MAGLVPEDAELPLVRAWLGLVELTRTDAGTGRAVADVEREISAVIMWHRRPSLDADVVDALTALTRGLWTAMCATEGAMSAERAREVLALVADALLPQTTESGSSF